MSRVSGGALCLGDPERTKSRVVFWRMAQRHADSAIPVDCLSPHGIGNAVIVGTVGETARYQRSMAKQTRHLQLPIPGGGFGFETIRIWGRWHERCPSENRSTSFESAWIVCNAEMQSIVVPKTAEFSRIVEIRVRGVATGGGVKSNTGETSAETEEVEWHQRSATNDDAFARGGQRNQASTCRNPRYY